MDYFYFLLSLTVVSISLVVCLVCGIMLWVKRNGVPDRSRLILSLICFCSAVSCAWRIWTYLAGPDFMPYKELFLPFQLLVGLAILTFFILYPVEVMRPGWLFTLDQSERVKGVGRLLLFFLPAVIMLVAMAAGMEFLPIYSWSDISTHLFLRPDMVLRILVAVCIAGLTVVVLVLPYNWRESSVDNRWRRCFALMMLVTVLLLFGQLLTHVLLFHYLHLLWFAFVVAYYTYYELHERVLPAPLAETGIQDVTPQTVGVDLWQSISKILEGQQMWRNPDIDVNGMATMVLSNSYSVGQCVKSNTGLSFDDYVNRLRTDFMVGELRREPKQAIERLFFIAGFRSRATASRCFLKFQNITPTDFVTLISKNSQRV